MKKTFNPKLLIYDPTCSFCVGLAKYFQKEYGIKIVRNNSGFLPHIENLSINVKKDVHYIVSIARINVVYSGMEAAVEIISDKYPLARKLYHLPLIKQIADSLYFIIKKSRKYL